MIPHYKWAWPPDWDRHSRYSVFDCPRLWFRLWPATLAAEEVRVAVDGNRVVCADDTQRGVWVLTGDEDTENKAVLGVWPD